MPGIPLKDLETTLPSLRQLVGSVKGEEYFRGLDPKVIVPVTYAVEDNDVVENTPITDYNIPSITTSKEGDTALTELGRMFVYDEGNSKWVLWFTFNPVDGKVYTNNTLTGDGSVSNKLSVNTSVVALKGDLNPLLKGVDNGGGTFDFSKHDGTDSFTIYETRIISDVDALRNEVGRYDKEVIFLEGYHPGIKGSGNGLLYWDEDSTETDNGGTIFQVTGLPTGRWKRIVKYSLKIEDFGAYGDGITDDSEFVESALNYTRSVNGKLECSAGKTYLIEQNVSISMDGVSYLEWDLMGATLDFQSGGGLSLGQAIPFLETTTATDLIKGATKFDVNDTTGVSKGDLVFIVSPVEWVSGIYLQQTYTIGDVDGNTIYVDGLIVGDISEQQKTDASVVGDTVVRFYKLSKNLTLRNGNITSTTRDGASTLLYLRCQDQYLIENIAVYQPNRSGVYTIYCGKGQIHNCTTVDSGYVEGDQGYNSVPSSPSGLSYGYGFITANSYVTHFIGCHSYSGWHGFDVARGQTFAIFNDCVIHKDAFGFSSHEGSWSFEIYNSEVLGGLCVTTRSAELIIKDCKFTTSLSRCIIGNGSHQSLIVSGNILDVSGGGSGNVFYFNAPYPLYCYSAQEAYTEISRNTIVGAGNTSKLGYRGDVIISDNYIRSLSTTSTSNNITVYNNGISGNKVMITKNNLHNYGTQSAFSIGGSDSGKIFIVDNLTEGTAPITNSFLIYLNNICTEIHLINNISKGYTGIVRMNKDGNIFKIIQNNYASARIITVDSPHSATVSNLINNTYGSVVFVGSVTITNDVNNTLLQ